MLICYSIQLFRCFLSGLFLASNMKSGQLQVAAWLPGHHGEKNVSNVALANNTL